MNDVRCRSSSIRLKLLGWFLVAGLLVGLSSLAPAYWNPTSPKLAKPVWSVGPGGYWGFRSTPTVADGVVYCGSLAKSVYSVEVATGKVRWTTPVGGRITFSSPAVGEGVVVVGCEDKKTYGLSARDGTVLWTVGTGGRVEGSPAIDGGVAFIGSTDHNLYAVRLNDGSIVWKVAVKGAIFCRPLVADGKVYFGEEWPDGKTFYCVNKSDGKTIFKVETGGGIYSSPVLGGGKLYFGSMDKKVYCVDAESGVSAWARELPQPIASSPALVGGIVVIGCQDGVIYGLDAMDGSIRWNLPLQFDWQMEPDAQGNIPKKSFSPNLTTPVAHNGNAIMPVAYGVLSISVADGKLASTILLEDPVDAPGVTIAEKRIIVATRNALQAFEF